MKFRDTEINPIFAIFGLPIVVVATITITIIEIVKGIARKLETPLECAYGFFAFVFLRCFSEAMKLFEKE